MSITYGITYDGKQCCACDAAWLPAVNEELLEQGWAGTFLIEPLTALAGGILGGVAVSALAWRLAWRQRTNRALLVTARRLRR